MTLHVVILVAIAGVAWSSVLVQVKSDLPSMDVNDQSKFVTGVLRLVNAQEGYLEDYDDPAPGDEQYDSKDEVDPAPADYHYYFKDEDDGPLEAGKLAKDEPTHAASNTKNYDDITSVMYDTFQSPITDLHNITDWINTTVSSSQLSDSLPEGTLGLSDALSTLDNWVESEVASDVVNVTSVEADVTSPAANVQKAGDGISLEKFMYVNDNVIIYENKLNNSTFQKLNYALVINKDIPEDVNSNKVKKKNSTEEVINIKNEHNLVPDALPAKNAYYSVHSSIVPSRTLSSESSEEYRDTEADNIQIYDITKQPNDTMMAYDVFLLNTSIPHSYAESTEASQTEASRTFSASISTDDLLGYQLNPSTTALPAITSQPQLKLIFNSIVTDKSTSLTSQVLTLPSLIFSQREQLYAETRILSTAKSLLSSTPTLNEIDYSGISSEETLNMTSYSPTTPAILNGVLASLFVDSSQSSFTLMLNSTAQTSTKLVASLIVPASTEIAATETISTTLLLQTTQILPTISFPTAVSTDEALRKQTYSFLDFNVSHSTNDTSDFLSASVTEISLEWTASKTEQIPASSSKNVVDFKLGVSNKFSAAQTGRDTDGVILTTIESGWDPTTFIVLKLAMGWSEFCQRQASIRQEIVHILLSRDDSLMVAPDQIQITSEDHQNCLQDAPDTMVTSPEISTRLFLSNQTHQFDRLLTLVCAYILLGSDFQADLSPIFREKLLAVGIHDNNNRVPATTSTNKDQVKGDDSALSSDPGIIIGVTMAGVGGLYCLVVVVLQIIMRHKKRRSLTLNSKSSISATSFTSLQEISINKLASGSGLLNPVFDAAQMIEPSNPLNFIQLSTICRDYKRIHQEFMRIPNKMPRLSVVPPGQEDKNRYANVLPLSHSRVHLLPDGSEPYSSYINANFVTGPQRQSKYYIATQAPTEVTVADFWRMVWQQGCSAIVMLTHLEEDGQTRCASYFPELVGHGAAQRHGQFQVLLRHRDIHQEYIVSKLELNNLREIESRTIDHYWFTCWPRVGLPEPVALIKLLLDLRLRPDLGRSPMVVHCSSGTGRTGTFLTLDLCMHQYEKTGLVDVMHTVHSVRQERAGAVQNVDQYLFVYQAIIDYGTVAITPALSAASSATTLHALLP